MRGQRQPKQIRRRRTSYYMNWSDIECDGKVRGEKSEVLNDEYPAHRGLLLFVFHICEQGKAETAFSA